MILILMIIIGLMNAPIYALHLAERPINQKHFHEPYATFFDALLCNDINTVTTLLNKDIPVNVNNKWGDPALAVAVVFGSTQLIRLLLDYGADKAMTDRAGNTALTWAYTRKRMNPKCQEVDSIIILLKDDVLNLSY